MPLTKMTDSDHDTLSFANYVKLEPCEHISFEDIETEHVVGIFCA